MSLNRCLTPFLPELIPGERNYMLYCGVCHGLDLKGNLDLQFPPLLDIAKRKTRAEIELMTRQGRGRMPAYGDMPEAHHYDPIAI